MHLRSPAWCTISTNTGMAGRCKVHFCMSNICSSSIASLSIARWCGAVASAIIMSFPASVRNDLHASSVTITNTIALHALTQRCKSLALQDNQMPDLPCCRFTVHHLPNKHHSIQKQATQQACYCKVLGFVPLCWWDLSSPAHSGSQCFRLYLLGAHFTQRLTAGCNHIRGYTFAGPAAAQPNQRCAQHMRPKLPCPFGHMNMPPTCRNKSEQCLQLLACNSIPHSLQKTDHTTLQLQRVS